MRFSRGLCVLWLVLGLCGCLAPKPGLERTQFEKWERKDIAEVGISFDVPQRHGWAGPEVGGWYWKDDNPKQVVIAMHYRHPAEYDESRPLIRLSLYRLSPDQFAKYEKGETGGIVTREYYNLEPFTKYTPEMRVAKLAYPSRAGAEYLCFRKDYKAPNGDVVLAGAEIYPELLRPPYPEEWQAEDRKAVERVLNSIKVK